MVGGGVFDRRHRDLDDHVHLRSPASRLHAAATSGFLQLVFGYLLGRIVISILFIPSYFRGELLTVYQLLDQRFGGKIKMLAASLFVVMRNIADGIRLLLTAIVLAAVYAAFNPPQTPKRSSSRSIVLIGLAMIIFTYFGGMEAVIWVEVVQLGIYIAGAIAAAVVLSNSIDGGLRDGERGRHASLASIRSSISPSTTRNSTRSGQD